MGDTIRIQIEYTMTRDGMTFQDALYFTPQEYATITPEEIEAEKLRRLNNWYDILIATRIVTD